MGLNERKRAILTAIIRAYVESGEPIGSKALCDMLDFSLSSATLRNEMSDLCALGYLEQPHTSAGRVPTVLGYKLYIDDLMKHDSLSGEMKLVIDSLLEGVSGGIDDITLHASQVLSELTGLPVLTSTVSRESDTVKRIELMPVGKHSLLILLITSNGITKSKMLRSVGALSVELLAKFRKLCSEHIVGKQLSVLSRSYSQQLIAAVGDISLMTLTASLFDIIHEARQSRLSLKGESNLFRCYSRDGEVQRLMELLSQKELMLSLMSNVDSPVGVLFGNDTEINELKPATIVLAKYSTGGHELGHIGVIGPVRMSYDRVIPSLEYFASRMSKVISDTLTDLED